MPSDLVSRGGGADLRKKWHRAQGAGHRVEVSGFRKGLIPNFRHPDLTRKNFSVGPDF